MPASAFFDGFRIEGNEMVQRIVVFVMALSSFPQFAGAQAKSVSAVPGGTGAALPAGDAHLRISLNEVHSLLQTQAALLAKQAETLEHQQREIEELKQQIASGRHQPASDASQELTAASDAASLSFVTNPMRTSSEAMMATRPVPSAASHDSAQPLSDNPGSEKPLSIDFGHGRLTPGGWVDLTGYYRSTNVGSGLGTSFATIPFSNTVQGGLSETRLTAQSSRISVRADENFGATRVFGYAEADFNGYLPSNAYVSTNSASLRLRVYFTDVSRSRWELLGGQSWSLLTPNRVGVSPFLSEIYNTMHLDTNYQVGLTYARQAQLRAVYHFSDNLALGFSAENPEQFSGSAATFPALFSTAQTDIGSSTGAGGGTSTPALHPDLIAKLSADPTLREHKLHTEIAALLTPVAILTPATITGTTSEKDVREGSGITAAANLEVVKNLHLILTGFWSDGGGRYIGGLGPAFVVAQQGSKTSPFTAQLVHSGSGIATAEWQATRSTLLSMTYSAAYFGRAYSIDPSTGSFVGYGFPGSAASNNRALQEGTLASQTTLWRRPGFGAVQVITQSSYITRAPWFVAPKTAGNAHVFVGYANLRYVLP